MTLAPQETCKALADRNRVRILAALFNYKELCACEIYEWLTVSGATASKHLGILIRTNLILNRKDGRWVFYRINKSNPSNRKLLNWLKDQFAKDEKLQKDLLNLATGSNCLPLKKSI